MAPNGREALSQVINNAPDLILLDLLMPNMDGFQLCRRIRENPDWAGIPIIFLSSADDKELIVRAFESGVAARHPSRLAPVSRTRCHAARSGTARSRSQYRKP